jgi:hypothetical protein
LRHPRLVALIVLSLALLAPFAAGADPVAEELFLQSLSRGAQAPAQEPSLQDPVPGINGPAPQQRSCSISRDCGDGNTVACTGTYSCAYSTKGVKCDGAEVACPNFCSIGWTCSQCPSYVSYCYSTSGDCGVTNEGCNGGTKDCACPDIPPWW